MGQIHCQVTFPHNSLIAADSVVNTFSFTGIDNVEDQAIVAKGKLLAFYNTVAAGQVNPIKAYLSSELALLSARIKVYDASDPEPRVPILDVALGTTSVTPLNTQNLPGEVALAASYAAEAESGVAAARRRGRIYLGPLNVGAGSGSGATPSRPTTQFRSDVAKACQALAGSPVGTLWAVWSRKNSAYYVITRGYVDDAWDTQRRRGVATTTRTGWVSPG